MSQQEYERIADDATENGAPKQPRSKWTAFAVAIGIIVVIFAVAYFGIDGSGGVAGSRSANNVEIVDIDGTIGEAGDTYNQAFVESRISKAKLDPNNRAIMLLIDSPGGTVYESDETYLALMDYKKETGRPVYAYCESMCASGAYYIASAADEVIANRNSMVGSIGVICGQFVDATELLKKLGVDITTVHTGKNKLAGQYYETPTDEQIADYQVLSDEIYDRFVGIVAKGRDMSKDDVRALADGSVYSAEQCKKSGLIDDIMSRDEYSDHLREVLGDDVTFYHKVYEKGTLDSFLDFVKSSVGAARTDSSELASSLQALSDMTYDEPMMIYQPAAE